MKTIQRHAPLALAIAIAAAVPAAAQNGVDNAASDVANVATGIGNGVSNGVDAVGSAVDNSVDVNLTTDNTLAGTGSDVNLGASDLNATDGAMLNETDMVTTTETTTVPERSSGKGSWGLLGLAGLLSFLFRPKKPAIHLDERTRTGTR